MPAAAVIPAPLAYTIIVAVKRLVVGLNYLLTLNSYVPYIIIYFIIHGSTLFFFMHIIYNTHTHTHTHTYIFNTVNKSECIKHVILL